MSVETLQPIELPIPYPRSLGPLIDLSTGSSVSGHIDLGELGNPAREFLETRTAERNSFTVVAGLTAAYAKRIATIGAQRGTLERPGIAEFCAKDATDARFGTPDAADNPWQPDAVKKWQDKGDTKLAKFGRGVILLLEYSNKEVINPSTGIRDYRSHGYKLAGYGWTGPELAEPPKAETILGDPEEIEAKRARFIDLMQGFETTLALRISEEYTGLGLAVPFTKLIVAASNVVYGAQDFWLDTWKSNHAGHVYDKAGWQKLDVEFDAMRPSVLRGKDVPDTRTYFTFPNQLLPRAA
jgi:hypothetical protein